MSRHFIPQREADALSWYQSFVAAILLRPDFYLLPPERVAEAVRAVEAFAAAYAVAANLGSRTTLDVAAKRAAHKTADRWCRGLAAMLRANLGVSDAELLELGMRVRTPERKSPQALHTFPLVNIRYAVFGAHEMSYADSASPYSRAKAPEAAHLQLFMHVGDWECANADETRFKCVVTRSPFRVEHAEKDDGKIATYFGRWASGPGEVGPWSLPASMRITFAGGMAMAA
ncbi:MAG: hypothetical protein ACR2L2_06490 [Acidobacteriota bacterium]